MTFAEIIPFLAEGKTLSSKKAGGWKIKMIEDTLINVTNDYYLNKKEFVPYIVESIDFEVNDWRVVR